MNVGDRERATFHLTLLTLPQVSISSLQVIDLYGHIMAFQILDPLGRYHFYMQSRMKIMYAYACFNFPDDVPIQIPIKVNKSNNSNKYV
jgi:hypothetical protein